MSNGHSNKELQQALAGLFGAQENHYECDFCELIFDTRNGFLDHVIAFHRDVLEDLLRKAGKSWDEFMISYRAGTIWPAEDCPHTD